MSDDDELRRVSPRELDEMLAKHPDSAALHLYAAWVRDEPVLVEGDWVPAWLVAAGFRVRRVER